GFVVWVCDNRSASNRGTASGHHAYRRSSSRRWPHGSCPPSKAWKVGIVGAPVTDYRLYDSIYTERFMGLPKDNPEGYAATRIMDKAKDVEGALLLFHGTLDDNVHPQNTIQLVDALQKAGKDFELVLLPGAGHGPRTPEQVWFRYWKTWQFLKKNL
ncbi:MAG TPA: prolyl oligopeptidase family serine peptidase, partial [Holophaga sp.]|nr:prolyl oligopeptidase family serine peptidase [Holophaga sp.]